MQTISPAWVPVQKPGKVLFPFTANGVSQISLEAGAIVDVMEGFRDGQWYRGKLPDGRVGIFPSSFVLLTDASSTLLNKPSESLTRIDETVIEWGTELRAHYRNGRTKQFQTLRDRLVMLLNMRQMCSDPQIPEADRRHNMRVTLEKVDDFKRQMGFEMTVKKASGAPANESNTGINELVEMHVELALADQVHGSIGDAGGGKVKLARARRPRKRTMKGVILGREPVAKSDATPPEKVLIQLLFDFRAFVCKVGEDVQMFFQLLDGRTRSLVAEPFVVSLTPQGMVAEGGEKRALFVDIQAHELANFYLACRVVRTGNLQLLSDEKVKKKDDKKKEKDVKLKKEAVMRRPVGCGVVALSRELKNELTLAIYRIKGSDESQWGNMIEMIISDQTEKLELLPGSTGVVVGYNKYQMRREELMAEHPEYERLVCPRLHLSDFKPGDQRNDLYVWIEGLELNDLPSNTPVEVGVTARLESGRLMPNCASAGCGEKSKTLVRSLVLNSNSPIMREYFKLSLTPEDFAKAHLHFSVTMRHGKSGNLDKSSQKRSKGASDQESVGFSFLRLTREDGTVVANGEQGLQLYRQPKDISEMAFYLKANHAAELVSRRDSKLRLRTQFCSALMTQNETLLALISWTEKQDQLESIFKRLTFVDPQEIIKFMKETFDAIFAILDTKPSISMPVYNALIFIIGFVVDEKTSQFSNFRSMLDNYVKNHFKGIKAHRTLLTCMSTYLKKLDAPEYALQIRDSMKALEYLFHFIVTSRILYCQLEPVTETDTNEFKQCLIDCLSDFNTLMSLTSPTLIVAQTIALKNFSSMLHDLSEIYDIADLALIACTFICAISADESKKALHTEKLGLILELVSGAFYLNADSRAAIMPTVLNMLAQHMDGSIDELVVCIDILGAILDLVQTQLPEEAQPLATWELVPLLPKLLGALEAFPPDIELDRFKLIGVLLSFFHLMQPFMFEQYVEYLEDGKSRFIEATFHLCAVMLDRGFPTNWLAMNMLMCKQMHKLATVLTPFVLPEYPESVWRNYILLMLKLIAAPVLQWEALPTARRDAMRTRYGVDIRVQVAAELLKAWEDRVTPDKAPGLLGALIQPAVEMLLSQNQELSQYGLRLYLSLVHLEFSLTGSFTQVQDVTVTYMDQSSGDDIDSNAYALMGALEAHFSQSSETKYKSAGMTFLGEVRKMRELVADLNSLPPGPSYDDERVLATIGLMDFLLESRKLDSYFRYVHLLAAQHLASQSHTEAALTLLLHEDKIEWGSALFDAMELANLPRQTASDRKVALLNRSIEYLVTGKDWERAAGILRRLEDYYESIYDYEKLSAILAQRAELLQKIVSIERSPPEFYRVGYYGRGFPASISGKEFIYRGYELERLADFVARIQAKFPQAELLKTTDQPGQEVRNAPNKQYLLISTVQPSNEFEMNRQVNEEELVLKNRPVFVRKYAKYNSVCVFINAKPFRKEGAPKGVNEFADMWLRKTFLVTDATFPTFHRSSVIHESRAIEFSPIENAVEAIETKIGDLLEFIDKHSAEAGINLNPFTMSLNGVLDAAVNGGTQKYQEAFLTPEYLQEHPQNAQFVARLNTGLQETLIVLARAIAIHRRLCPLDMMKLHEHMEDAFGKLKSQFRGAFTSNTTAAVMAIPK